MQSSRSEPLPPEIAEDSAAKKQKQEPEKSKEMQGLCRKPTQEKQGQQIQESRNQAGNPVFGCSVNPSAMSDRHFGNPRALPLRHHRDETVKIPIQIDKANDRTPVQFNAAIKIVQTLAANQGDCQIKKL